MRAIIYIIRLKIRKYKLIIIILGVNIIIITRDNLVWTAGNGAPMHEACVPHRIHPQNTNILKIVIIGVFPYFAVLDPASPRYKRSTAAVVIRAASSQRSREG